MQAEAASKKPLTVDPNDDTSTLVSEKRVKPDPLGYRGPPNPDGIIKTTEMGPVEDYGSYKCTYEKHPGHLILSSDGIRFETRLTEGKRFEVKFKQMKRLEKVTRHVKKAIREESGSDLLFVDDADQEFMVTGVEERDQVFSQVVGYSGIKWQVVW